MYQPLPLCSPYSRFQERSQLKDNCQKSIEQLLAVKEVGIKFSWMYRSGYLGIPGLRHSRSMFQNWPLFKTNEPPWHPPAEPWDAFSQKVPCTFSHSTKQDEQLCTVDLPLSGLLLRKAFSSPNSRLSDWIPQTRAGPDLQSLHYFPISHTRSAGPISEIAHVLSMSPHLSGH